MINIYSAVARASDTGEAQEGLSVSVLNADQATLATIFEADGITNKINPFLSDDLGRIIFSAAPGRYYVQINTASGPETDPVDFYGVNESLAPGATVTDALNSLYEEFNTVVKLQGDQELTGTITFDKSPQVPSPQNAGDAVNRSYVDALGLSGYKPAALTIRFAVTAPLPACTYDNNAGTLTANANGALPAQGGVTGLTGDRAWVLGQASQATNGAYVLTQGDASHPWIMTRATDADTAAELGFFSAFVTEGTQAGYTYGVPLAPGSITLGTTAIVPTILSGPGGISGEAAARLAGDAAIQATYAPNEPPSPQGLRALLRKPDFTILDGLGPGDQRYIYGMSEQIAANTAGLAALNLSYLPEEPPGPQGLIALVKNRANQILLGLNPDGSIYPSSSGSGYQSILPNDSRLLVSDYCSIALRTASQLRFSRTISDANNHQWTSPGSRVGFATNSAFVTIIGNFTNLSTGSSNQVCGVLVDGVQTATFSSNSTTINLDGAVHEIELVWPYGASFDLTEIRIAPGAAISQKSARPSGIAVICGDSIEQGFFSSDVFHSWAFLLGVAQGVQIVNMGNASRLCVSADLAAAASVPGATKLFYCIGVNDYTGNTPLATFLSNLDGAYTAARGVSGTLPITFMSPIYNQVGDTATPTPNGIGATLPQYRSQFSTVKANHAGDANFFLLNGLLAMPNQPDNMADNTHPNNTGSGNIATYVAAHF